MYLKRFLYIYMYKMLKEFVSPNLRYKNGKVYYLNKYEMNLNNYNYEEENYYYEIKDINKKMDDIDFDLIISENDDKIIIQFEIEQERIDNINYLMKKINKSVINIDSDDGLTDIYNVYDIDIVN